MWHYSSDGGRHGPVSEQEIAAMIASGLIRPTSYVRSEADTEWREARETSLRGYFGDGVLASAQAADKARARASRVRDSGGGWIGGVVTLAFVAAVVGGGYWISQGGFNRAVEGTALERYVPASFLSDDALARRLQSQFEQQDVFRNTQSLRHFKELFPTDYATLMYEMVPLYRRNASSSEAEEVARQHMLSFLNTNKHFAAQASPETLGALLHAEAALMQALRSNTMVCAMAVDGRASTAEAERMITTANRAEADALNVALFDAIRSGQTSTNTYAPLGEPEWRQLGQTLIHAGIEPRALQQFGFSPTALSASERCTLVGQLFTVMSEEPDLALRARYGAQVVRGM